MTGEEGGRHASSEGGRTLDGKVALVTGASRGAGRGIAVELGLAGAHVIVTARSVRGASTMPSLPTTTADDTADLICAAGGSATAIRCDHTKPDEVETLMKRVEDEFGRLDVLVNNAWGGHDAQAEPGRGRDVWEEPLGQLRDMLLAGAYSDYLTCLLALRYLISRQTRGLIVTTTWHVPEPPGWLPYDVSKAAKNRLVYALGEKLRERSVAVVGVSPGWMRTEVMLEHHTPRELEGQTETPRYVGRAVTALAADAGVLRHTGQILDVGDLARLYGFTDLDGSQPHWYQAHRRKLAEQEKQTS